MKSDECYLYLFWDSFHNSRLFVCVWERTYSFIGVEGNAAGGKGADTNCAALPQYRGSDCAQRHDFSDEGLLCRLYKPLVCDCHDYMVHCGRL